MIKSLYRFMTSYYFARAATDFDRIHKSRIFARFETSKDWTGELDWSEAQPANNPIASKILPWGDVQQADETGV